MTSLMMSPSTHSICYSVLPKRRLAAAHSSSQCKPLQSAMQNAQRDFQRINSRKRTSTVDGTNSRGLTLVDLRIRCNLSTFGGPCTALSFCPSLSLKRHHRILLRYNKRHPYCCTTCVGLRRRQLSLCSPPTAFNVDKGSPEYHQTVRFFKRGIHISM